MARILTLAALIVTLSMATAAQASDPAKGKSVFGSQCAICHAVTSHSPSGIGPNLFGVVGRKAGSLPGYSYSNAMNAAATVWTEARLKAYIASPAQNIAGNKMPFPGLKNLTQVDDLTAYLATLK